MAVISPKKRPALPPRIGVTAGAVQDPYPGQPNRQAWEDAIRASPHDSALYQRYKVASAANFSVVYAPPVNTGPALPPIVGGTPNPLADVNPSPAQNRNSAIPKTGAVLPFPNPNQPQADLATPGLLPPPVPSVVGGVTAEAVKHPSQPNRQAWEDAIRAAPHDRGLYDRYVAESKSGFSTLPPVAPGSANLGGLPPVAPGSANLGGLPPVGGGGPTAQLRPPDSALTAPAGALPPAPGPTAAETPEEELKRLQREFSALQMAGEGDPNYRMSAGTAVRLRFLEERITQLFNQTRGTTKPEEGGKEGKGGKGPFEKVADWIANLPSWLRAILRVPTGGIVDAVGQFGKAYVEKLTDEQIEEALAALTGAPGAEDRLQELEDEKTARAKAKMATEMETLVKTLGLDAYGVTAEELAGYSPDQFLQLYNRKDSKMTDIQLRGFLETWQKQNPGQKIPVPTDKNSRAYQIFYRNMKDARKADALFAPEVAGPAGTVTPQQIADYIRKMKGDAILPRNAAQAYIWLQQSLEPPPGLVDNGLGWVNADGSPPTPEQQQALNAYESRLETQKSDREAAYRLIATRDGQAAANAARQKDYENDLELQKKRDEKAEERAVSSDLRAVWMGTEAEIRLESRTISAEQRAEATRIAAEGRAAAARIVDEARQEGRVTAAELRAIQVGKDAEVRLESRTISAEQRAEATRIAAEGRAIQVGIAEEGRAIKAGVEAEKRLESRTISAEQRAEATRIAEEGRAIRAGVEAERRLESRTISAEQRAEATRIAAEGRAVQAGIEAERRLEDRTISAEQRAEAARIAAEGRAVLAGVEAERRAEAAQVAAEGRAATTRIQQRASGGAPVGAEVTAGYRASLKGFTTVPTTLEEAKGWLGQTLPAPPGLTYDATTNQWVDESGNLPTGDRAQAVQDYEFQQSQYAKNRERADAIVRSYTDLAAVQRGRDAADAALQRALGTKDVLEQVELTYLLEKADLDLKETQRKSQMVQAYVALTNNPSTAARMKSLGLLDQFNRDTGMNVTVPDKVSKDKVFAMIPSLGDWANMSPQQQMDALEMLSARTGWMPEELAALMSEVAGAPGGFRGGGVSSSTVARSR